jgi:spore photoproduct lyase
VIFVNAGAFFEALAGLPYVETFVAISYDTDLLAIDSLTDFISGWMDFVLTRPLFTFELRTKAVNTGPLMVKDVPSNLIISYTLSPQEIISRYEHFTPNAKSRIAAVNRLLDAGYRVRLAFEPLLPIDDFENIYEAFVRDVTENIDLKRIEDVSVSPFHINRRYLQYLKGYYSTSPVLNYPYDDIDDTSVVRKIDSERMLKTVTGILKEEMDENKIFIWEPGKNKQNNLLPGL